MPLELIGWADLALLVFAVMIGFGLALILWGILKRAVFGRNEASTTIYDWDHGLLYLNGRFSKILPAGRYTNFSIGRRRDIFTIRRRSYFQMPLPLDVTSAEKLPFRVSAVMIYDVADPQKAFEASDLQKSFQLALAAALTRLASEKSLDAFLTERGSLDGSLMAMLSEPMEGCSIQSATIVSVTLPPEIRRMFTEVERAKLEGQAALERARGEHAALRSLANAARMLKGNPELVNLRVLQALSGSNGKRQATLVLGQNALLPVGEQADTVQD
ncbi:SPFH domain-containing protein [Microvirga pudoricolor]|uniref:SPFH domain-containing protein n=1 Tax=Microvirga pudoricolor TaxID=2778729 RepID=UPI0019520F13|nr:SPFH domain-containing protein [Microvirga pudoricolor]MBM6592641.1 hypothetical protein [Microvirga pudoricolor]